MGMNPREYERFLVDLTLMNPLEMSKGGITTRDLMLKEIYSQSNKESIAIKCSILDLILNKGSNEKIGKLWNDLHWDQDTPWLMSLMIGINPFKCDLMTNLIWVNSIFKKFECQSNQMVNPIELINVNLGVNTNVKMYPIEKEGYRMLNKMMNNESIMSETNCNWNWEMTIAKDIEEKICFNLVDEGIELLEKVHKRQHVFTKKAEKYLIKEASMLHKENS